MSYSHSSQPTGNTWPPRTANEDEGVVSQSQPHVMNGPAACYACTMRSVGVWFDVSEREKKALQQSSWLVSSGRGVVLFLLLPRR